MKGLKLGATRNKLIEVFPLISLYIGYISDQSQGFQSKSGYGVMKLTEVVTSLSL